VEVVFDSPGAPNLGLVAEGNGYFMGLTPGARAGVRYRFRLDGEEYLYPDPASRFQPEGPHGPSEVIDPRSFTWSDRDWPGLGPDGNYLKSFGDHYFTKKHRTDWGDALNFDDQDAGPVREFLISNARYWVDEFHVDGYRFDATQAIVDSSPEHMLAAITRAAR